MRRAERRNFDDLHAEADMGEMEAATDQAAVAEQLLHLFGVGVGRDVEVLGLEAKEQVADGAADEEGLVARILQPIQDFQRSGRYARP